LKEYLLGLKKEIFYAYKTGIEDSTRRINEVKNQLNEFEIILQDYDHYARMFQFPDETLGCQRTLELIRAEVNAVMLLW
jgi:dynein heavy chain